MKAQYRCETCLTYHDTPHQAKECERICMQKKLKERQMNKVEQQVFVALEREERAFTLTQMQKALSDRGCYNSQYASGYVACLRDFMRTRHDIPMLLLRFDVPASMPNDKTCPICASERVTFESQCEQNGMITYLYECNNCGHNSGGINRRFRAADKAQAAWGLK